MSLVVPAVLPYSRENLEKKLALLALIPSVSRIQIDVVDGRLAAPASWPYTAPKELKAMVENGELLPSLDRIEYEIDLMSFDALRAAEDWLALGASRLTFHAESAVDLAQFFASARKRWSGGLASFSSIVSFGLALTVGSNLALVRSCASAIDYVQFMGIMKVGRQGEPFDERVVEKIKAFRTLYPDLPLQVDGGVSLKNGKKLLALGVSNLVVGSGILRARDPAAAFAAFEDLEGPYGV